MLTNLTRALIDAAAVGCFMAAIGCVALAMGAA